jgi:RNA polymerase sigma-70 factor (ECF subfamily)
MLGFAHSSSRSTPDDAMLGYVRGDSPGAFEDLYAFLSPRLYALCLRLAGCKADADDVFQEAFLKLHGARASYSPGKNVYPWAVAVTRSVYIDRLRRIKRRPEDLAPTSDERHDLDDVGRSPGSAMMPDTHANASDLLRIVERELERMTERNRSAYLLVRRDGLNAHEAADRLGTTSSVIKQRVHRADNAIRSAVSRGGW